MWKLGPMKTKTYKTVNLLNVFFVSKHTTVKLFLF